MVELEAKEYEKIKCSNDYVKFEPFEGNIKRLKEIAGFKTDLELNTEDGTVLGLHIEVNDDGDLELKVSHFVGVVHIAKTSEDELILRVSPKFDKLCPIKMLIETLSHPIVSKYIKFGKTYEIMTDKEPIRLSSTSSEYVLFLILHYFKVLYDLIKRGLQKGYVKAEENFRGRVKGKILVGRNVRENLPKAKFHHIFCSFNQYTEDTLENRILKAAFLKGKDYIRRLSNNLIDENVKHRIGVISLSFERVSTVRIYPTDFRLITIQKIRQDYKLAIELAKKILKILGYDPNSSLEKDLKEIYPYWIDMNELFERYCEVKLREGEIEELKGYKVFPGYEDKNISTEAGGLRPDFILVKGNEYVIVDAKYKPIYDGEENEGDKKGDLQQLSLYGRIKAEILENHIRNNFGEEVKLKEREAKLYILYPTNKSNTKPKELNPFINIYKIGVNLPKSLTLSR